MAVTSSFVELPIPSLPYFPLVGNVFALRNERLKLLQQISQQFGDIGAFHFGPRLVPVLNSPELVRQALVEHGDNFEKTATVRALGAPVLGNGVFLSEGEEHRRQRKLLASLFQHRRVLEYASIVSVCASDMLTSWKEGEIINAGEEMTRLTLWIISKILFDADVSGKEHELGEALTYLFRHFANAMTNPLRLPLSWPTPRNRRAQRALARINTTLYAMIDERRRKADERSDVLSSLLRVQDAELQSMLSAQQVRDEALSLFVAGHETTATALSWCLYLLARHPEISQRVQEEVDRVLAGRLPTAADLAHLPYTLQVFKETLRLYPPVYAFTRRAVSSIPLDNYRIPAGASVVISPYTLQRRARFFPEPERFQPERFAPQQEQALPRYAYLPFGAGTHGCPGMHLALFEGHLLLALLAQRLTFEPVGSGEIEPEPLLTLRPKEAIALRVRRR